MGLETQLASEVNINLTLPAFSAETTPSSLAVAIELFELNHVPPNVGDKKVLVPAQIESGPMIAATGMGWITTSMLVSDVQLERVEVK